MAASINLDIISALEILLILQESFFSFFMGWLMFNFERTAHFMPLFSFYIPWKHEKTVKFSDVFRGYRNRPVVWNGLKKRRLRESNFSPEGMKIVLTKPRDNLKRPAITWNNWNKFKPRRSLQKPLKALTKLPETTWNHP